MREAERKSEREREREGASERRLYQVDMWTQRSPRGFVKDVRGEDVSLLSQVLFYLRFLYFRSVISVHPSVRPYVCLAGGISCSNSTTSVTRNFVKIPYLGFFPTICPHIVNFLKIGT
jgi:hypothetical protein